MLEQPDDDMQYTALRFMDDLWVHGRCIIWDLALDLMFRKDDVRLTSATPEIVQNIESLLENTNGRIVWCAVGSLGSLLGDGTCMTLGRGINSNSKYLGGVRAVIDAPKILQKITVMLENSNSEIQEAAINFFAKLWKHGVCASFGPSY